MADVPGISNDVFSKVTEKIREAINNRNAKEDIFGVRPTKTYNQLRTEEIKLLRGIGQGAGGLEPNSRWTTKDTAQDGLNFSASELNEPNSIYPRRLIIKDMVTLEEIIIQFVPAELDINPESNFANISPMARNNPLYHYTGSEDIIKFSLDWFSQLTDRTDVLTNCRKLEALSKNDGFGNPPHHIKLIWHDIMFSDSTFIVIAAPYKLSMFNPQYNMLPQQAYQEVILKRVSSTNLGIEQIRKITN